MPKLPSLTEATLMSSVATSFSLWDEYCSRAVVRYDEFGQRCDLDPGVNYFVLMLEQLGAVTHYSCEGHPSFNKPGSFYVLFTAPMSLALKLQACGFFNVELEGKNRWSIRRTFDDIIQKEGCLRFAALQWRDHFGRIIEYPGINAARKTSPKKAPKKALKKRSAKRLR
jgi:hypothetical protein